MPILDVSIIGDLESGRTQLCRSMCGMEFEDTHRDTECREYRINPNIDSAPIKKGEHTSAGLLRSIPEGEAWMRCWDSLIDPEFQGKRVFLYCVDLSKDAIDEDEIVKEIDRIRAYYLRTKIILVGTKADKAKGAQQAQLIDFAKRQGLEVHVTSAKKRTGVAELKEKLFKFPSVRLDSARSNPMESAPKTKHHWMHHVSLGLVALAVVTFITLMLLSVFLPPVIPALAVVLPFLPALSPVAAGFAAGGIGAGILLLFAGGMKTADILKQPKQEARERVALDMELPSNSQMDGLHSGASQQPQVVPIPGFYAASPIPRTEGQQELEEETSLPASPSGVAAPVSRGFI